MSISPDSSETRELGQAVRHLRKARRLTQQELAMAAGVGRGVLQKLEEGRGTVNVDSLMRIARALSCDVRLMARRHRDGALTPRG